MTPTATAQDKQQPPDVEAIERDADDARKRAEELRQQRARMSVEALADPRVAAELRDVESELAEAERTVALAELAGPEIERRQQEAIERREHEHRARLQSQLFALDGKVYKLARVADEKLRAALVSVHELDEVFSKRRGIRTELEIALGAKTVGGGGESLRPRLERALTHHALETGNPRGLLEFEDLPPGDLHPLTYGERSPETETKQ